jgi:hypothetical protein
MKLVLFFFGAAFANNKLVEKNRIYFYRDFSNAELNPQEQKIKHLKIVTDGFVDWYLNETIHQEEEILSPFDKRENIIRRFKVLLRLTD